MKKIKVKPDLKPHKLTENVWHYRERTYFDIYVHKEAGKIINFRIYYRSALR